MRKPYADDKDVEATFINRVEAIRAQEGDDFYARHKKVDEQTNMTKADEKLALNSANSK